MTKKRKQKWQDDRREKRDKEVEQKSQHRDKNSQVQGVASQKLGDDQWYRPRSSWKIHSSAHECSMKSIEILKPDIQEENGVEHTFTIKSSVLLLSNVSVCSCFLSSFSAPFSSLPNKKKEEEKRQANLVESQFCIFQRTTQKKKQKDLKNNREMLHPNRERLHIAVVVVGQHL